MTESLISILQKDWLRIAGLVVKKRGRKITDLCFAKRTNSGYAFFLDKEVSWDMLHEITEELANLYPHYEYALLAEASSELANTDLL